MPRFTVMLCVHRETALLPFAIESVLWQTHDDFELFVVCDGAPAPTIDRARSFAARDPRVRVFDFPKGERNGERHRDAVLANASGQFVAQIAYDDIWFPNHLKELDALLGEVEFGNLTLMGILPDGSPDHFPGDLKDDATQHRLLTEKWNFFGPTVAGYRLSTYRRLPEGWAPAPPDIFSDLHMWRKFLRLDGITVATRFTIQSLCLHNAYRQHMTMDQRWEESAHFMGIIRDPLQRAALVDRYWGSLAKAQIAAVTSRATEIESLHRRLAELESRLTGHHSPRQS